MRKKLRIAAVICLGLLLLVALGAFALWKALQHVPEAYRQALEADPAQQRKASDRMLQRSTALRNDVEKPGTWEALFTDEEINGWLAVDLVENHPDTLPKTVSDPRVAIRPDQMMLFCRFRQGDFTTVLTLAVEPYVPEPNVLALRIRKVRAGAVPWRLDKVLDRISEAAARQDLQLQWRQADGDPVALMTISPRVDKDDGLVRIEKLQLGDGEIYLAGTTERPARRRRKFIRP